MSTRQGSWECLSCGHVKNYTGWTDPAVECPECGHPRGEPVKKAAKKAAKKPSRRSARKAKK